MNSKRININGPAGNLIQSNFPYVISLFLGILAGDWSVQLPVSPVCAVVGSAVVLPCSFDFPRSSNRSEKIGGLLAQVKNNKWIRGDRDNSCRVSQLLSVSGWWRRSPTLQGSVWDVVSWKQPLYHTKVLIPSKTFSHKEFTGFLMKHLTLFLPLRYVFHSAGILHDPSFQGRVEYFGQPGTANCSLKISDLKQSDSGTYVFYLITDHPTEKMPDQSGIQLIVAGRGISIYRDPEPFFMEYSVLLSISLQNLSTKWKNGHKIKTDLFAPTWDLVFLKRSHAWYWQTSHPPSILTFLFSSCTRNWTVLVFNLTP